MTDPVVLVNQGKLRGRTDTDRNGGLYYSFFAIPYAKPPIEQLRFRDPEPPEPWTGIRDATAEGNECYSKNMFREMLMGSEDCLILNVFTQELPKTISNMKPVMVWIHGGGFTTGSSKIELYGPDFLICEDVVIVSINYRIGALGFLSLEDPSLGVPGNAGLKDMVMALKWVQDNIRQFNGDPNNVTIFGESAGGAAVHYLMLSPMAKNLFHKAIAQSGCALNLWAYGSRCGGELAKHLGCTSSDEKEILKVLQEVSKEELFEAQQKIPDTFYANELKAIAPVVEIVNANEQAFLSDTPINIMLSGNYNKVPLLIGYTSREGLLLHISNTRESDTPRITNFEQAVPHLLHLPVKSPMSIKIGNLIKEFYYGDEEPGSQHEDNYCFLQTDNLILRGLYSTAKNILASSECPVYFYRFSVDAKLNICKRFLNITAPGACHSDELGYLFKTALTPTIRPGSLEDVCLRRMTRFWTNFARTGNPNSKEKDPLFTVDWPAVTRTSFNFIEIGDNLTIGVDPEPERMRFWDSIYGLNPATSML